MKGHVLYLKIKYKPKGFVNYLLINIFIIQKSKIINFLFLNSYNKCRYTFDINLKKKVDSTEVYPLSLKPPFKIKNNPRAIVQTHSPDKIIFFHFSLRIIIKNISIRHSPQNHRRSKNFCQRNTRLIQIRFFKHKLHKIFCPQKHANTHRD